MPANNLPKMPEPVAYLVTMPSGKVRGYYDDKLTAIALSMPNDTITDLHDGRACYLAGIEAAKACVPTEESGPSQWAKGSNDARELTLANLDALGRE